MMNFWESMTRITSASTSSRIWLCWACRSSSGIGFVVAEAMAYGTSRVASRGAVWQRCQTAPLFSINQKQQPARSQTDVPRLGPLTQSAPHLLGNLHLQMSYIAFSRGDLQVQIQRDFVGRLTELHQP